MNASSIGPLQAVPLAQRAVVAAADQLPLAPRPCGNGQSRSGRRAAGGPRQLLPSIIDLGLACGYRADRGPAEIDSVKAETFFVVDLRTGALGSGQLGLDAGLLPVLLQAVDLRPSTIGCSAASRW